MKLFGNVLLVSVLWLGGFAGCVAEAQKDLPGFAWIPGGDFEMGDHHGFVDPKHGGDESPVHPVRLAPFYMGIYHVTTQQYCDFLNRAQNDVQIEVRQGGVYLVGREELLFETREMSPFSRIVWEENHFSVLDGKEQHPIVCVRWPGAALYCNWMSTQQKRPPCYNIDDWTCNLGVSGFRLPTEAEWEYAARGGLRDPYRNFPWGDEPDPARANWPESTNPYRTGPEPWTTPVGFFDGQLHLRTDFGWPGMAESFQTANGANAYGLHDMAGNVWQFVNDWYARDYYAHSPVDNPAGPEVGSRMPDGKPYHGMRGGNWYNGEYGHSRVSNRNPSYWRGPQDPDHPYYHVGFRVVLPVDAEKRPQTAPESRTRGENSPEPPSRQRGDERGQGPRPPQPPGQGDPLDRTSSGPGRVETQDFTPLRTGAMSLHSPAVGPDGLLPAQFAADGGGSSPPLAWSGVPIGARSLAITMHHIAPDRTKSYWVVYNIPAETRSLPGDVTGVGVLGVNDINGRAAYAPPNSKGPGPKTYILTIYALSGPPSFREPSEQIGRDALLAGIKDLVLDSAELRVTYSRSGDGVDSARPARPPRRVNEPLGPGTGGGRPVERRRDEAGPRAGDGERIPDGADRQIAEQQALLDTLGYLGPNPDQAPAGGGAGAKGRGTPESRMPAASDPNQTVGLFLNTPEAFAGYTLFAPKHNTVTYLMDNQGRWVHQWKSAYEPGQTVYLQSNGHLLHTCFTRNHDFTGGGEGGRIEEFDWEGNLVWEFEFSTDRQLSHHDIAPLPNGNILMLVVEKKSREECLRAGFHPDRLRDGQLFPDSVVEIQPQYPKGGVIVWEWRVWDHLIQDYDPARENYGVVADHPERIDVDCNGRAVPAFWNHMNGIDYSAELDQILLSVRGCNEIWIIDHGTTTAEAAGRTGGRQGKGGDLLYRWGNPEAYGRGGASDRQLFQQHDAQWIPAGYPGAGHITVFNNGYERGWSSIEEIAPPVDSTGQYTMGKGVVFGPDAPLWHYEAKNQSDFFSAEISGAHRLPNGNTLICAGVIGHLFEVNASGAVVWQYVNPMVRGGTLAQGEVPGKDLRGHRFNAVFKAHRYPTDYPGLNGRDLTPRSVIELPASEKGQTGLHERNEEPDGRRGPGDRPPRQAGGRAPRDRG